MPTVVTKTIKPAGGGDYTTVQAALVAYPGNLVAQDVVLRLECYGGNAGAVDIPSTYTTDASRYVHIVAASSARHSGVWDDAMARCEGPEAGGSAVLHGPWGSPSPGGVVVDGMLLRSSAGSAIDDESGPLNGGGIIVARGCIARAPSGLAYRRCAEVTNCVAEQCTYGVSAAKRDGAPTKASCVTVVGAAIAGFFGNDDAQPVVKNCIAQNCTDGFSGTFSAASDYNISDIDGDAPGAHSKTGVVQFVDAAAKDYHLSPADTVARGAGVNLTASGITTDIDGDARPATGAWDIGADQVAESPTPTPASSYGSGAKLKMMYGAYSQDRKREDAEVLMVIEKFLEVVSG